MCFSPIDFISQNLLIILIFFAYQLDGSKIIYYKYVFTNPLKLINRVEHLNITAIHCYCIVMKPIILLS